jgi:hypothetical protein
MIALIDLPNLLSTSATGAKEACHSMIRMSPPKEMENSSRAEMRA